MSKESKISEGLALLHEKNNYQPLTQPIVENTTRKVACVAGVRKGRERELGRETTREGGGRRGTPARKPLFSPSRLLIKKNNKNNATVND